MPYIRIQKDKENPYVMINKETIQDKRLSWRARGVMAYLLSLPDDWKIYIKELSDHSRDGEHVTAKSLKELIDTGYVTRELIRNKKGYLKGYNYTIHENPRLNKDNSRNKPKLNYPQPDIPDTVDCSLLSIDTKLSNEDTNIYADEPHDFKYRVISDRYIELFKQHTGLKPTTNWPAFNKSLKMKKSILTTEDVLQALDNYFEDEYVRDKLVFNPLFFVNNIDKYRIKTKKIGLAEKCGLYTSKDLL